MRQRTSAALYAYWNEVRQGRIAPRRFDIEPARISELLPDTFMLEQDPSGTFKYRLAGTHICAFFQSEFRGRNFLADWTAADRETIERHLSDITLRGGVGLFTIEFQADNNEVALFEMIILPLVHMQDSINRYLGAISPINKPMWMNRVAPITQRLVRNEIIWPEGRPHVLAERARRQVPFAPHIRHGRLVRSDRRQFRVYDGGLSAPDNKNV